MKINPEFLLNYYSTCEEIGGMDSAINPFNVNHYDENNQPIFELDDDDDGED